MSNTLAPAHAYLPSNEAFSFARHVIFRTQVDLFLRTDIGTIEARLGPFDPVDMPPDFVCRFDVMPEYDRNKIANAYAFVILNKMVIAFETQADLTRWLTPYLQRITRADW